MRSVAFIIAALLLPPPSVAAQAPDGTHALAVSQRLGMEVQTPSASWCATTPKLDVVVQQVATLTAPEILGLLQRVGSTVVAKECPTAQAIAFTGMVKGSTTVVWQATAAASDNWQVRVEPPPPPPAIDLDAVSDAPPPPLAPVLLAVPGAGLSVTVLGHPVVLSPKADLTHTVSVDGWVIGRDQSDYAPAIVDARTVGTTGYALVALPNSGNACPGGQYYLVVLHQDRAVKTNTFGSCTEQRPEIRNGNGGWIAQSPGPVAESVSTFTLDGDRVVTTTRRVPIPAAGPVVGDARTLLLGKSAGDLVTIPLADQAIRSAIGASYPAFRSLILNGPQGPFVRRGDLLVGFGCRAHACDTENFTVAFTSGNKAFVRWLHNGVQAFYGDPSAFVKQTLETR